MRRLPFSLVISAVTLLAVARPASAEFVYAFELAVERVVLDGATLDDDPAADRIEENRVEVELDLEYSPANDYYLFYTGALFATTETTESAGDQSREDGVEHRQAGFGLFFGDTLQGRLRIGRLDLGDDDPWWTWVDEEVDAIELELSRGNFEGGLMLAEAQAPRASNESRIEPALDGVSYARLTLGWEPVAGHDLGIDLLRQRDGSASAIVGERFDAAREDGVDADIDWVGVFYRGQVEVDRLGDIELEVYRAELAGKERRYEFDEVGDQRIEVEEIVRADLSATASAWRVGFRPAALADWRIRVGGLTASGDGDADDGVNRAWRQSGIHGDNEIYGVLYQPALSNLELSMIAVDWRATDRLTLGLARFDYRKQRRAGDAPDNEIDLDAEGAGSRLGSEVDLTVTAELLESLNLQLSLARFSPGSAYDDPPAAAADYLGLEVDWQF